MKKMLKEIAIMTFMIGVFVLVGCERSEPFIEKSIEESKEESIEEEFIEKFTEGLWLKMGDNTIVATDDIDFYDMSMHMIYLKKKLPYLEKVGFDSGIMTVNVGKEEIYQCPFHSSYSSMHPQGVYISSPPFNKEDIIRINFMQVFDINHNPTVTDPRNDERIIATLKKYQQYHEGLHLELKSFNYSNGTLVLNIELYNPDTFNYYYLDPDTMGISLFNYYTNGPIFYDSTNHKSYTHQEIFTRPEPWYLWKKEWLSLIQSGDRKNISITYNHFEMIPAGNYRMFFVFPGLNYGISQKDLILEDGRIWMGSIGIEENVTIN